MDAMRASRVTSRMAGSEAQGAAPALSWRVVPAVLAAVLVGCGGGAGEPDVPDAAASRRLAAVARLVEDLPTADAVRPGARDDRGAGLDGLKVVATGRSGAGRYLGVAHHARGDTFDVVLVQSADLLRWRRVRVLGRDASQAALARAADGSYVVAWEQADPARPGGERPAHVRVLHAADVTGLRAGRFDARFDAPRTLAPTAEGTPDLRRVRLRDGPGDSTIELGFHRYADRDVDREALGTLEDFSRWRARARPGLDAALTARGLRGNFGDRDTFSLDGAGYELVEAQARKGDFGSWRVLLRDDATGALRTLRFRAPDGQRAFGNPTASVLPGPAGGRVLFVSVFAFTEGAPRGGAGELLSVRRLSTPAVRP
jgi:hypothetical protein